jgi:hypothetical protein
MEREKSSSDVGEGESKVHRVIVSCKDASEADEPLYT